MSDPRLFGETIPAMSENPSLAIGSRVSPNIGTEKLIGCVSGTSSSSRLFQNRWVCVTETPLWGGPTGLAVVVKMTGDSR